MIEKFEISRLQELDKVCEFIKMAFPNPTFFAFDGEMGSGKTTTIGQIIQSFGIQHFEGSPTYAIIQEYANSRSQKVYHLDCYRIENERDAFNLGLEELFEEKAWFFIEWAKNIHFLLPDKVVWVYLRYDKVKETRTITFTYDN